MPVETSTWSPSTDRSFVLRRAHLALVLLASLALIAVVGESANADASTHRHLGKPRTRAEGPSHRRKHGGHRTARARASIIGGKVAAYGSFPWLAYIEFKSPQETFSCSGTIASSNLVLTAGHCAVDSETGRIHEASGYQVITGNVNWNSSEREVSDVSRVIVYPNYRIGGSLAGWGDAALLQLSAPISSPAIKLATSEIWRPGTEAAIAGWGKTFYAQEVPTEHLRWAVTYVQSREWCNAKAPGFHPLGQVCTIKPPYYESGACEGDSGGPLLALRPGSEELLEIGVTSGGYGECATTWPDVFTRSDLIAPWVNNRIAELAPAPLPAPPSSSLRAAPQLPRMTRRQAVAYVRRALREELGFRFKYRRQYRVNCRRLKAPRQRCSVSWWTGPNDYWGSVTVFYTVEGTAVGWGARYRIRWVNDYCYRHARHRARCRIHVRRG